MTKEPETLKKMLTGIEKRTASIGIIGLGYVGLPLVLEFIRAGFEVKGFDLDERKVALLKQGKSYIKHIPAEKISAMNRTKRFIPTTDFSMIKRTDCILICVPTPLNEHREPDISYVIETTKTISRYLRKGHLVVLESTTYPGTTIRPLIIGRNITDEGPEYLVASESVALDTLGFQVLRDVTPGEAVLVTTDGTFHSRECADRTVHAPCIFEFVYLARPDSLIDGISVYEGRVKMGEYLAAKIHRTMPQLKVDAVIPIPDSSRPAAMELASRLNLPYREGFVKNRYIGRTFIMPGQAVRRKSVRQKLNTIAQEFRGNNVLLVDDSIVRGTTSREIVQMAREAGARKVYFASAAPPVRYPNV